MVDEPDGDDLIFIVFKPLLDENDDDDDAFAGEFFEYKSFWFWMHWQFANILKKLLKSTLA